MEQQEQNAEFLRDFDTSLTIGQKGEKMFEEFISDKYPKIQVQNTSMNPDYTWKEIDFILTYPDGKVRTVELKTDSYTNTPNISVETMANKERNRLGWIHTSEADVLAYLFINGLQHGEPNLWMIDMKRLRTYVENNKTLRDIVVTPERQVRGPGWKTTIIKLVPRSKIIPLATYHIEPVQTNNPHSAREKRNM